MTTIILVAIGVLIAAVAALMTIFYGGGAYDTAQAKADAGRLVTEGVQVQAAVQAFRAQEDRMPGNGSGIDQQAIRDLLDRKYLTHVPRGLDDTGYDASWKIDYNYGIARSVVGRADDQRAMAICKMARLQVNLQGEPKRCEDPTISTVEPCCIMSAEDAGL